MVISVVRSLFYIYPSILCMICYDSIRFKIHLILLKTTIQFIGKEKEIEIRNHLHDDKAGVAHFYHTMDGL